jgi:hypothetical protein
MRFANLTWFYDFIQVVNIIRKHYTSNEYFPKQIVFTMIYLLHEHKLKPRNYYEHKIIMITFV